MVPLGDPRAAAPFAVKCPVEGQGRWVDQTTFVHEFSKPLPGGVTCSFDLRDDLKSLSGYAIVGQRHFTVDSGGPVARAVLPSRSEEHTSELQSLMRISYAVFCLKKKKKHTACNIQ